MSQEDNIAAEFGLTPGEMRVASVIARGIGARAAARELGLSYHTIRVTLRSVFLKTDVHTQGALAVLFLTPRRMNSNDLPQGTRGRGLRFSSRRVVQGEDRPAKRNVS